MTRRLPAHAMQQRPPTFASRDDEATFWDTHDLSDYFQASDFRPERLDIESGEELPIYFDARTARILRQEAARRGMDLESLVVMLLLERFEQLELGDNSTAD